MHHQHGTSVRCGALTLRPILGALGMLAALCVGASVVRAQCETWSPLSTGMDIRVEDVAKLPDDQIIAAGTFFTAGGTAALNVARWDGGTWHAMGAEILGNPYVLLPLPNGDIVVGGTFQLPSTPTSYVNVARWDGAAWQAMGGGLPFSVYAMTLMPNGDIIAGGQALGTFEGLARWDGFTWSPLAGGGVDNHVYSLTTLANGDVIAGGRFLNAGGLPASKIARWNGTTWQSLGSGLPTFCKSVVALPNGDLVAGGYFGISQWDGISWNPLGPGVNSTANDVVALPNGDLIVGGEFSSAGGVGNTGGIARWDGQTWHPLGSGTTGGLTSSVRSVIARSDGSLVAGGYFTSIGGVTANRIASYEPCLAFHSRFGAGCYAPALQLDASPAPISTATTGTTVTYSISNIPDATGTSGVHVGATVISFVGLDPGVDLGTLGAAACQAYVGTLDLMLPFVDTFGADSNSTTLQLPPGLPPGAQLTAQAVALTVNGLLNPAGITTSNGVRSLVHAN
ncbi:MAG: delta-60 repeat domain-containing protein [Planctomycetota bacterium]